METNKEIIVKEATKEKGILVEQNIHAIVGLKEGIYNIAGLTIKRIKNTFIVL